MDGFVLGTAPMLTNGCFLPLYPGLAALMGAAWAANALNVLSGGSGCWCLRVCSPGCSSLPVLLPAIYANALICDRLLGTMTLPCTWPVIASGFKLESVAETGAFLGQLVFFLSFALVFGWPLVLLPLIARGRQRRLLGSLTRHHLLLTRASGLLLIASRIHGFAIGVVPCMRSRG